MKPYSGKLDDLDRKAEEVWIRLADPDYYSRDYTGLLQGTWARVVEAAFLYTDVGERGRPVTCRCGTCKKCRNRANQRRFYERQKEKRAIKQTW
jgi:hypothetical protein